MRRRNRRQPHQPQAGDEDGEERKNTEQRAELPIRFVLFVEETIDEEIVERIAGKHRIVDPLNRRQRLVEVGGLYFHRIIAPAARGQEKVGVDFLLRRHPVEIFQDPDDDMRVVAAAHDDRLTERSIARRKAQRPHSGFVDDDALLVIGAECLRKVAPGCQV